MQEAKGCDVVVVGTGNGGLSAAAYLAKAGKKFGWVHPCRTYALSDVTLEVPVL